MKIGKQEIKLTHLDKIYFPKDGLTKGDVINYYQKISSYILPYLKDRPESLYRLPNGINKVGFYQKDADENTPEWVEIREIFSESTEKIVHYIICNNKQTIAYLNNLGCIEFNTWNSRITKEEYPDYLVLDIDPSARNNFSEVIEVALAAEEILNALNIESYPKTSGSTGLHIYIPMNARYTYEEVKDLAYILMQSINQSLPDLTTLERSLEKRSKSKIYLDYLQNAKGQTLCSVYSLRPRNGASVSTPLEWEELKRGLSPLDFNIWNTLNRLKEKGDLFKPVMGKSIDYTEVFKNLKNIKI